MLIEFSVKNFMSFKNKVTLSMEKGTGDELPSNTFNINDIELLNITAIYGANASGKSNIIKAISGAISMVRNSNIIPIGGKWNFIKPFLFDETSKKEPSEFEFIFIANNIKYKYFFSADKDKVYEESLDAYYSQKPTNIFTRKNTNLYEFTNDKSKLESLATNNTDNKLFLTTATTWNYDKTKDAFLWFTNEIDLYETYDNILDKDLIDYSNNDLKTFAIKLFKEADILIKDVNVDYEETKNYNIELTHEIKNNEGNTNLYKLNINDESSGTKTLFALAPYLKRAFENPKVIIIDELEKSLHPSLVEFIIKLFNNKKINKANSQLIFTTHATNLLDIELLRRDQIWFTEKEQNTGISDLYPLDSFSVRKDENIMKGYINGRYGAIPFIKETDLWLEDK